MNFSLKRIIAIIEPNTGIRCRKTPALLAPIIPIPLIQKKKDARPFKVAENITMMVIDPITGKKANFGSKKTIIESFKKTKLDLKNKEFNTINDRLKNNNILRFY